MTVTTTAIDGTVAVEEKVVLGPEKKSSMDTLNGFGQNKMVVTLNEFTFTAKMISRPAESVLVEAVKVASRDTTVTRKDLLCGRMYKPTGVTVVAASPTRHTKRIIHDADNQRQYLGMESWWTKQAKVVQKSVKAPPHLRLALLKTAKTLGLTVSPMLLARANEVIE